MLMTVMLMLLMCMYRLDMFAINQHHADDKELHAFEDVIHAPSTYATLVCVDDSGTPFTRIWCLHELDHTLRAGCDKLQLLTCKGAIYGDCTHAGDRLPHHTQGCALLAVDQCSAFMA